PLSPAAAPAVRRVVRGDQSDPREGRAPPHGRDRPRDPAAAHAAHGSESRAAPGGAQGARARRMSEPAGVLVVGALGRRGRAVRAALASESSLVLAAALEGKEHPEQGARLEHGVVVGDDVAAAMAACDVAIDFSVPQATLAIAGAAADAGVAYVTGTTGFS